MTTRRRTSRGLVASWLAACLVSWLVAAAFFTAACGSPRGPGSSGSSLDKNNPPSRSDCALVEQKCSRCHEIERIAIYRASSPEQWQSLVARMRRQRGSDIDEHEGDVITACLVDRQFGRDEARQSESQPENQPGGGSPDEDDHAE